MCRRNSENQTRREARGGGAVLDAVKQVEFVTAQVFWLCLSSMWWLVSAITRSAALPGVTDNVDGPHISSITV
jgi:hypothetical protein